MNIAIAFERNNAVKIIILAESGYIRFPWHENGETRRRYYGADGA